MSTIELAERKVRARALGYYVFAAATLALLISGQGATRWGDFLHGMWLGLTGTAVLSFLPFARWLKPHSPVARLLDDDSAREHRRLATTAGFWAAMASAAGTMIAAESGAPLDGATVARIIATAGAVAALVGFATLELRAQA